MCASFCTLCQHKTPRSPSPATLINLLAVDEVKDIDGDSITLWCPILTVKIVEVARQALVEDGLTTESEGSITAN